MKNNKNHNIEYSYYSSPLYGVNTPANLPPVKSVCSFSGY